jgi:hypothetical protein
MKVYENMSASKLNVQNHKKLSKITQIPYLLYADTTDVYILELYTCNAPLSLWSK